MKKITATFLTTLLAVLLPFLSVPTSVQAQVLPKSRVRSQRPTLLPIPVGVNIQLSLEILDAHDGISNKNVECYAIVRVNDKPVEGMIGGKPRTALSRSNPVTRQRGETLALDNIAYLYPPFLKFAPVALEVALYDKDTGSQDDLLEKWTTSIDLKSRQEIVLHGDKANLHIRVVPQPKVERMVIRLSCQVLDASDGVNDDTVECYATLRVGDTTRTGWKREQAKSLQKNETLVLEPVFYTGSGDVKLNIALYDRDSGSKDDVLGTWSLMVNPAAIYGKAPIVLEGAKAKLFVSAVKAPPLQTQDAPQTALPLGKKAK